MCLPRPDASRVLFARLLDRVDVCFGGLFSGRAHVVGLSPNEGVERNVAYATGFGDHVPLDCLNRIRRQAASHREHVGEPVLGDRVALLRGFPEKCRCAWFVSLPQTSPALWSLDYYNTGIKALETKNLESAQRKLEMAYRYVPENSEVNFALGNLWLEKGDTARTKDFYRQAIAINARHNSAYNNLGVVEMGEGDWAQAREDLQHAIAIEPGDGKTHYLLARVLLQLGDLTAAKTEIETALRLRPQQKEFQQLHDEIAARANSAQ